MLISLVVLLATGSAVAALQKAPDPTQQQTLGALTHRAMTDPRFEARVQHYLADHGLTHPQRADLHGAAPLDAARAVLHTEVRSGRTVAQWIDLAKADHLLAREPAMPVHGDLVLDTSRLAKLAGAPYSAAQLADVRAQAAALDPATRQALADLVQRVADAYEAQAPLAATLALRFQRATGVTDLILTDSEREATLANALSIVAAQNAFRAAAPSLSFDAAFQDPEGLVVLGTTGNDIYEPAGLFGDAILVVDPAGNDLYHTTAGSACPDALSVAHACNGLVASVLLDLAGDDVYSYTGAPTDAIGSASAGGIGVLMDVAGNDQYRTLMERTSENALFMYIDAGAMGYGLAGVGILVDGAGDDLYQSDITTTQRDQWLLSQGFGNAGGVGISADASGNDAWLSNGYDSGLPNDDRHQPFQGLYPDGTGFYGGVGIMADTGAGDDLYHAWDNATTTDFYADGFAAFGGTGIFYEDGGNDDYQAVESATDPWIMPLLNCAYGTASFGGLGVFLDMGGNDQYWGDTISPRATSTLNEGFGGPAEGEGIFVDVSGDDGHFMRATSGNGQGVTGGRGALFGEGEGGNILGVVDVRGALGIGNVGGVFLDAGGADQYTGAHPSHDNAAWIGGADVNAGSVPAIFLLGS